MQKIKDAYRRFVSGLKEESVEMIDLVERRQAYVDTLCSLCKAEGMEPNVIRIRAVVNSNSEADIVRVIDAVRRFGVSALMASIGR